MTDYAHVLCIECKCRILKDPNNEIKADLSKRFGMSELLCPTCIEKSDKAIDTLTHKNRERAQEIQELKSRLDFLKQENTTLIRKVGMLTEIINCNDLQTKIKEQAARIEVLERQLSDYWWKSSPGNFS